MNIFKALFGNKTSSEKNDEQITRTIVIKSNTTYDGIDTEFIDQIFFPTEEERQEFISLIEKIIQELNITSETTRVEFMDIFPKYINDKEIELPFIAELFKFHTTIDTVLKNDNKIIESKEGPEEIIGRSKISHYYIAMKLCAHNLIEKNKASYESIDEEEILFLNTLKDDTKDYVRLNNLVLLGRSFMLRNNLDKMVKYYQNILDDNFELSPNTIADHLRIAGEDFYEMKQYDKALYFLKKGLELNPKLGVKKLVAEIEKNPH
jgi:tetratricopeptide (TPR) repeat protein